MHLNCTQFYRVQIPTNTLNHFTHHWGPWLASRQELVHTKNELLLAETCIVGNPPQLEGRVAPHRRLPRSTYRASIQRKWPRKRLCVQPVWCSQQASSPNSQDLKPKGKQFLRIFAVELPLDSMSEAWPLPGQGPARWAPLAVHLKTWEADSWWFMPSMPSRYRWYFLSILKS